MSDTKHRRKSIITILGALLTGISSSSLFIYLWTQSGIRGINSDILQNGDHVMLGDVLTVVAMIILAGISITLLLKLIRDNPTYTTKVVIVVCVAMTVLFMFCFIESLQYT